MYALIAKRQKQIFTDKNLTSQYLLSTEDSTELNTSVDIFISSKQILDLLSFKYILLMLNCDMLIRI